MSRLNRLAGALPLLAALMMTTSGAGAQQARVTPMTPDMYPAYDAVRPQADYVRRVAMVPMRDGVKLYTVIVFKKGTQDGPILLSRTPYNAGKATSRMPSQRIVDILPLMDAEFVDDGYIRVYQDVRGRNGSEGEYVVNRPIRGPLNDTGIDHATDAYDTIDWLVKNVPESNGKVGITGSSYVGFTALVATIDPHPALKASVPQSPMVDGWMGDDWFHNGAFRQLGLDYATGQMTNAGDNGPVPTGKGDDYLKYLRAGSAGDYARAYGVDKFPFYQKLAQNPAYTGFWSLQAVDKWIAERPLSVPTMLVVGQWDQEDSYGAPAAYAALKDKPGAKDKLHLVIGPWRHSQVNYQGDSLGALRFPGDTALEFRTRYMKPFLDHYLKGAPDPKIPRALTYQTGVNRWDASSQWPAGKAKSLYLGADFSLSFSPPAAAGHDEYISDPAKPVPFVPRPIDARDADVWKPWLVHDQRFVSDRPDVLVYQTAPLEEAVHIMGPPQVDLYASTSGSDSDWVVKLIDVYPDGDTYTPEMSGYELPIGIEIFRGRYAHSFENPQALAPGKVERYRFGLPNVNHTFKAGHRIMVQVQSSLFPLYDRNPQQYVPNIFDAKPGDYVKATQQVYFGAGTASAIVLPVAGD
ncbi:CocE/NonD family hydrolase [Stenotrophomonas tumulicola]|uniref:CocE/NonD family hydrolase n=1 Tax=Stenotrophomonas tumulicola TaxID=1685415 RepID=A0A7W3FNY0_9GAMM|nr:CocE/NonD family hydrolase [Stenotrophomonas tumulicola]